MDWQGWFSLFVIAGTLVLLIVTRYPTHIILMGALTLLTVSGVLTPNEALVGFSNPGLLTVAAMFIVAAGIQSCGGVDIIINRLLGNPKSERVALWRIFLPVSLLSGVLNNTPVVATMIPAVNEWSKRINLAPSKLMIPLSYSAILGGTLTLIGTSTNLIVNGQYMAITGEAGFSLFEITALSLPVIICGIAFMWVIFPFVLPNRQNAAPFSDLREFTLEVQIKSDGPLVGKTITQAGLRNLKSIFLIEIERGGKLLTAVSPEEKLQANDVLIFAGNTDAISDLLKINGLTPVTSEQHEVAVQDRRLVEVVVAPSCGAIGNTLRDAEFRNRYAAAVLAVARNGERVTGNLGSIQLRAGDTLLLETQPSFLTRQRYSKDFLVVNELDHEAPNHEKAGLAWGILLAAVVSAGVGLLSMFNAALLAAGIMLITRCLTVKQAERSLDLTVLITIAASFALGAALQKTGVAQLIADQILQLSLGYVFLLLLLTYFSVSLLTEMITNNAAAVLMLPIVLSVTENAALNPTPFIFALMIAASASFATPLGYQTNLMVYGPGNYHFRDFLKVGVPMNLFTGLITVTLLYFFWL